MPIQKFECGCGLQFERSTVKRVFNCPSCNTEVKAKLPSRINGQLSVKVDGPTPQNTGTSIDTDYDRVIAQSAKQGWAKVRQRYEHKKELLRLNPGSTGDDITRTPEGEWKIRPSQETKVIKSVQKDLRK